jgi:hypothetical protein
MPAVRGIPGKELFGWWHGIHANRMCL